MVPLTGGDGSGLGRDGGKPVSPLLERTAGRPAFRAGRPGAGRGRPGWTLVAVAFGVIMVGLDATVVAVANPAIARSLHGSLGDLQWITNSYLLVLGVAR